METIIKKTRELGTSAGVLLPRKWLDKTVIVTLASISEEDIFMKVLEIMAEERLNKEIKGVFLFGSYARKEQDPDSDIDILIVTEKTDKLIKSGRYEINIVPERKIIKEYPHSLFYQSIFREAKGLINQSLIHKYVSVKKPDFRKNLQEIKNMIRINRESAGLCEDMGKKIPDGVMYSIILRMRELHIIKSLLKNKSFRKKDFIKSVGEKNYSAYIRVKREEKELNNTSPKEARDLLKISEKWLKELKD